MSQQVNAKEMIEKLVKEITRLQKLCRNNGIDPRPPHRGNNATMSVKTDIQVFKTKEEAEEYQKSLNK